MMAGPISHSVPIMLDSNFTSCGIHCAICSRFSWHFPAEPTALCVLKIAHDELGPSAIAVTAVSPTFPESEIHAPVWHRKSERDIASSRPINYAFPTSSTMTPAAATTARLIFTRP